MSRAYLKYYDKPSALAPYRFIFDMLLTRNPNRRVALQNRQKDYAALIENPDLMRLHQRFHQIMCDAADASDTYDYGEGYFYQSLARISLTGFLSLALASGAKRVFAFDIMPHLIAIAEEAALFLEIDNVTFSVASFDDISNAEKFDVVLSFANHSTFDGQTRTTLEEYFDRCHQVCADDGVLIFESHPPAHEGDGLPHVLAEIEKRFKIIKQRILDGDRFLDNGRTFVVAEKKPS